MEFNKLPLTNTIITKSLNFLITLIFSLLYATLVNSQQEYVNNNQLQCNNNFNNTDGFVCNGNQSSCAAYVTFRSEPPTYATAPNIAFLLNSSVSDIATLNNISDVDPIPASRLVVIPVTCSCTRTRSNSKSQGRGKRYYQHNASYKLKAMGETYFTMANTTYQGLTTCQAMMAQNPHDFRNLTVGEEFLVPLMCACPTAEQARKYSARYLVSYLVTWGDDIDQIAHMFGTDTQTVLDANDLKSDDIIYPFTPILVPLKSEPTKLNLPSPPPSPVPQSSTNPAPIPTGGSQGSKTKWLYIGIGIVAGAVALVVSFAFAWACLIRPSRKPVSTAMNERRMDKKDQGPSEYVPLPVTYSTNSSQNTTSSSMVMDGFKVAIGSLKAYKFEELEKATEKFRETNRIKGSVFRGKFKGDDAAIKNMKGKVPTDEINLLKHIKHSNIIRLSGYCIHKGNTYLVYEYAEKGSIDKWLFRHQKQHSEDNSLSSSVLGWKQRVQIACNVSDALNYLHSYINPPYIHKNLKTSNILLDASYRAKITNFGLARTVEDEGENGELHLTKHVVGTHGYLAPEYIENGVVTAKLDVFAFGVIVLELLSGKPAVRPSGMNNGGPDDLLFILIRKVFEGEDVREKLMRFMDPNLGRAYPLDLAYSISQLAHKCVDHNMNMRPSMFEVSMTLTKIYSSSMEWDPSNELANSSSLSHSR